MADAYPEPSPSQRGADDRVAPQHAQPGHQTDIHRLRSRCWWVVFGCVVTAALFTLVGVIQLTMLNEIDLPITWEQQGWLTGEEFFGIVTAASLATSVVWLAWLFRAVANLRAISAPAMTWSPRAAVVWNLIPLVNLVMGFFILRSVWQASFGRADTAPLLVSSWAITAIVPAVTALAPAIMAGDLAAYDVRAEAAANLLQMVNCGLAALLVIQLTRAQAHMRHVADTFA